MSNGICFYNNSTMHVWFTSQSLSLSFCLCRSFFLLAINGVTLGRLFNLFVPQLTQLYNGKCNSKTAMRILLYFRIYFDQTLNFNL